MRADITDSAFVRVLGSRKLETAKARSPALLKLQWRSFGTRKPQQVTRYRPTAPPVPSRIREEGTTCQREPWPDLVEKALFEIDPNLRPQRLRDAKKAIRDRLLELDEERKMLLEARQKLDDRRETAPENVQ